MKSLNTTNQLYQRKMVILIHSSMSNKKKISDRERRQMRKKENTDWIGGIENTNVQNVEKS